MSEWINCEDSLPEDDTLCLAIDPCDVIWTAHFEGGEFYADTGIVEDLIITHWMPLPEPPKE